MSLTQLDEIYLKIYSIDYLLKCRVEEVSGNSVKLSPKSGKIDMFLINDPTVLIHFEGNQLVTIPADVVSVDRETGIVTVAQPEKDLNEEERIFERYPVSLVVSARRKFTNRRQELIVKNISMFSMDVISKTLFEEDEFIDLDLITEKSMFYISGKVLAKKAAGKLYEYSLQLTHFDIATKQSFEDYLLRQKLEYINMIKKAR
jgi:hypothetical protein